jgi:hypothetical protein
MSDEPDRPSFGEFCSPAPVREHRTVCLASVGTGRTTDTR